jgi:hypothetical protein
VFRFRNYQHTAATIMHSHGTPPVIVAGMLGHSVSILLTTYAHFIPTMQDQAAQLMVDILIPIPFEMEAKKVIIIRRMLGYGRVITIPSLTYLVIVNVLYG